MTPADMFDFGIRRIIVLRHWSRRGYQRVYLRNGAVADVPPKDCPWRKLRFIAPNGRLL
jgi:hypothetical protein